MRSQPNAVAPSELGGQIYLLEDDESLAVEITRAFAQEGETLHRIHDDAALFRVSDEPGAVLVLDRLVGGRDSLDALAEIRAAGRSIPVVVISSLATVDDRILGLKAGGDDYLTKPFAMGELLARVAALRRRSAIAPTTRLKVGPLTLDLISRTANRAGRAIDLLPREYTLLEYLMRHAGQVVTRAMLLEDVWHYRLSTHTNVVDVHVGNLRRKIDWEGETKLIANVRGLGFRLDPDGAAA